MPPTIQVDQMMGFSLYMIKAGLDGRSLNKNLDAVREHSLYAKEITPLFNYHARWYWTGMASASFRFKTLAARNGQYGSRKYSRASKTMSARPLRMISSA